MRVHSAALLLLLAACTDSGDPECSTYDEVFVYFDADNDGFGSDEPVGYTCTPGPNEATNKSDCDDLRADVHPDGVEVCDGVDNNCNNLADEGFPSIPWYEDLDGDNYGTQASKTEPLCEPPGPEWVTNGGDCDDNDPGAFPSAIEICNDGVDDDCDGFADDRDIGVDPTSYFQWYADADGDGFGDVDFVVSSCAPPVPDAILDGTDCDDTDININPDQVEVCDQIDNDCDGLIDDDDPNIDASTQTEFHADSDGDGFGDPDVMELACRPTLGLAVPNDNDCDDSDPLVNVIQDWYLDDDGDGYGSGMSVALSCLSPYPGTTPLDGDCNELDATENPGTPEVCDDTIDQNCNGLVDCDDPDCGGAAGCLLICADEPVEGVPALVTGNTTGQINDSNPSCSASTAQDYAIQWVAPASGLYTFSLANSTYDTVLYLRDGCSLADLACNDDISFPGNLQSEVTYYASAGQVLIVVVDGFATETGDFELEIF